MSTTVSAWRPDLEQEFFKFVALIRSDGIVKPWPADAATPRYHHTYLELDGWDYWSVGAPISETVLINGALLTRPRCGPAPASGGAVVATQPGGVQCGLIARGSDTVQRSVPPDRTR